MNLDKSIKQFVFEGFKKIDVKAGFVQGSSLVLQNAADNFRIPLDPHSKTHRWIASLKSSQAFALNMFNGIDSKNTIEFEVGHKALTTKAQIDVRITDENQQRVELYEVKAFEFITPKKIEFAVSYFNKESYKGFKYTDAYINFITEVVRVFSENNTVLYGEGIKQLCCHILGILNELDTQYKGKKIELYSLCLDAKIGNSNYQEMVKNFEAALSKFQSQVNKFLSDLNLSDQIEYKGFLDAYEYFKETITVKDSDANDYLKKRYFYLHA